MIVSSHSVRKTNVASWRNVSKKIKPFVECITKNSLYNITRLTLRMFLTKKASFYYNNNTKWLFQVFSEITSILRQKYSVI